MYQKHTLLGSGVPGPQGMGPHSPMQAGCPTAQPSLVGPPKSGPSRLRALNRHLVTSFSEVGSPHNLLPPHLPTRLPRHPQHRLRCWLVQITGKIKENPRPGTCHSHLQPRNTTFLYGSWCQENLLWAWESAAVLWTLLVTAPWKALLASSSDSQACGAAGTPLLKQCAGASNRRASQNTGDTQEDNLKGHFKAHECCLFLLFRKHRRKAPDC